MRTRQYHYISIVIFIAIIICVVGLWLSFVTLNRKIPPVESLTRTHIISGNFDQAKVKTEAEWKALLTPEQYHILREAGTEIPFSGALLGEKRKGTYVSVGCEQPVFRSEQKFESGTGWPSFWAPIHENAVVLREDTSLGTTRVEVLDMCGGHLGHVFDDGPEPTGKRYCMNSAALRFIPDEGE